jgi:pimeloyl-ACP methyl ester carboxylesterase
MFHQRMTSAMQVICLAGEMIMGVQWATAISFPLTQDIAAQPRGQVIPRVVCASDPNETYAIYLPSNYDPGRKWPILYAFDPAARGEVAVKTFQEAAEKYGYIVVGSNNSRNGPWVGTFAAIRSLWLDTHTRYSLDDARAYTAGFSGGARAATMMAQSLSGKIAGVIACGAGFPLGSGQGPSKNTPFVYFATIGIRDFNFRELRDLNAKLSQLGLTHRLAIFDGPHQWAPANLATEALGWMEIQAMRSGRRTRDDVLIDAIYARQSEEARRLKESGDLAGAFHRDQEMVEDFRGLRDVSGAETQVAIMKDTKELKQALKREAKREAHIAGLEDDYYTTYKRVMSAIFSPASGEYERQQAIRELHLGDLLDEKTKRPDTDEGIAAQRNLSGVMIHSLEDGAAASARGEFLHARVDMQIAIQCAPENGYIFYQLARAHALNKDLRNALQALRQAIEKGFSNLDDLEKNPDFASLRGESGYREAVELLKKKLESSPAPAN